MDTVRSKSKRRFRVTLVLQQEVELEDCVGPADVLEKEIVAEALSCPEVSEVFIQEISVDDKLRDG